MCTNCHLPRIISNGIFKCYLITQAENRMLWGVWLAQSVKRLPSAQVMIPGSRDRAPRQTPCSAGSLLLPLLVAPPAYALSLSLSVKQTNTILKLKKIQLTFVKSTTQLVKAKILGHITEQILGTGSHLLQLISQVKGKRAYTLSMCICICRRKKYTK